MVMTTTAMVTTGVIMVMVLSVVAALHIGVVVQSLGQQSLYCLIGLAGDTAVELNVGICQGVLSASANATADDGIHV